MDIITGFSAGATIATGIAPTSVTILRNGATLGANTVGDTALIVGTYDSAGNTFTPTTGGSSTLFVYDQDGVTNTGVYRSVVLVGYVDGAGNDTMSTAGVLTSVAG